MAKRLNIAIDFDGTVADTNPLKAAWIKKNLRLDVPPSTCDRARCVPIIGIENYELMAESVYGAEATALTPPVQGAVEAIQLLARRASLLVVTNRRGLNLRYAESWLATQRISTHIEAVVSAAGTTKARICAESGLAILLDDDIRHRATAADVCLTFVLFDSHRNGLAASNVHRVQTWREFVTFVDTFGRAGPDI